MAEGLCPICKTSSASIAEYGDTLQVACNRCGAFGITTLAFACLDKIFAEDRNASSKVSYFLKRITLNNSKYLLTREALDSAVLQTSLPTPPEQLDNLIYFLGDSNSDAGEGKNLSFEHVALIGASSYNNLGFIAEAAQNLKLIDGAILKHANGSDYVNLTRIRLTIDGWKAYIDLRKGKTEGKQAFMAMKFGDPMMDRIYLDHFKRAATDTGFELKRLDEGQAAGLIDDRLRVEIRKSIPHC
jgi:hypothetical protein